MSGQVIQLHQHRQARAGGAFAAVNIAARRMGYPDDYAYAIACKAKRQVLDGVGSAAGVVSHIKAQLRAEATGLHA